MGRSELERLSREELIELVLRLQRPAKTSRTSSKPPSTDREEQRERAKPGGAKPGHEGHSRVMVSPAYARVHPGASDTSASPARLFPVRGGSPEIDRAEKRDLQFLPRTRGFT